MKNKKKINRLIIDFILLSILVCIDQFTKYLAIIKLKDNDSFVIIKNVFELHYLENSGAAFGLMKNQKIFFIFVGIIMLFITTYVIVKVPATKKYNPLQITLVVIAAGAIGNMIDRLRFDYVVDFFYFELINFPIFNVADIYVTVAATVLIFLFLFYYKEEDLNFLSIKQKKYREMK